jgi:putative DNA primase/helicase
MSLTTAMHAACAAVGVQPPGRTKPGEWVRCPVEGKARSNRSGAVLVFDDGRGGIVWNWVSGQQQRFTAEGLAGEGEVKAPRRDPDAERRARETQQAAEQAAGEMVRAAEVQPHPYLAAKGFADETGLVLDDPAALTPQAETWSGMRHQLAQMAGPFLVVPGRVAKRVVTVQLVDTEGRKLNMKAAPMKGAAHRIATGRETWVCEGIATALTVRAALRLLGRSATVLSAFSAANVAKVAERLNGSVIAADHDAPQEALHGKGAGEFYAARTGHRWTMPPALGDWNDYHQSEGLRAVALRLREVPP